MVSVIPFPHLPLQVVAEVAAPLSQAKRVVMVSGNNSELGVKKMTGEILQMVTMLPDTVKQMTGVDISQVREKQGVGNHVGLRSKTAIMSLFNVTAKCNCQY